MRRSEAKATATQNTAIADTMEARGKAVLRIITAMKSALHI
jgi:hypothetical protein